MKCIHCGQDLKSVGLKQVNEVDGQLVFEMECFKCRKYNYIDSQAYFLIKKDECSETIKPINNKLPGQMNVIFCSLQRCAISWIIRVLSQYHEAMFGQPIKYTKENAEISQVIATRMRFPLPQGWNCVYEVDPKKLLERGYDRVVVIKRDLETLKKVHEIYFQEDFEWQQRETFFKKLEKAWHLVYDDNPENPRFLKLHLDDLNNYTKSTFTELMDFLNFPRKGRPPIIPIPTQRDWEAYSSILNKDEKINSKLRSLNSIYHDFVYKKPLKAHIEISPIVNYNAKLQRILIIGPHKQNSVHFSEKIHDAFIKLNYLSSYISPLDLKDNDWNAYISKQKRYKLSKTLERIKFIPDLILIEECNFWWDNDVSMPVFYKHREFKRPPTVFYPDVAFFWHEDVIPFYQTLLAPEWMSRVKYKFPLYVAIDPEQYKSKQKKYKGINGIGYREDITYEDVYGYPELSNIADMVLLKREEEEFKRKGYQYFDTPITDEMYREILPQCEVVWIPISCKQYISRRMLEAMSCKTGCLLTLENKRHEEILKNMGFKEGVHYLSMNKVSEKSSNFKKLINNAYKKVLKYHTYEQRALTLIKYYDDLKFGIQRYDVICPVYWINERFMENIDHWFQEIPIRKLYLGVNNKKLDIRCKHPQVELIDQTNFFTLGKCLADLISRVKTEWFVYLHADADPLKGSFKMLESEIKEDVGIIESERYHWDGSYDKIDVPHYTTENDHDRARAYSGYQLIRKKAIESILDKINDDFIYRNEDIIFHSECLKNDYKYVKSWALHVHQVFDQKWTYSYNETHLMQVKGLIKYTCPNDINKRALIDPLVWCKKNLPKKYDFTLNRILFFCYQYNPNWGEIIIEAWNQ